MIRFVDKVADSSYGVLSNLRYLKYIMITLLLFTVACLSLPSPLWVIRTTSADFEVELSVLFENANLNRVIETLENKLEATITVVSSGKNHNFIIYFYIKSETEFLHSLFVFSLLKGCPTLLLKKYLSVSIS